MFPELEILLIMRNRKLKLEAIVINSAAITPSEKSYTALSYMFCMRTQSDFTTIKSFETFRIARWDIPKCIRLTGGSN